MPMQPDRVVNARRTSPLAVASLVAAMVAGCPSRNPTVPAHEGWNLVWNDEFNVDGPVSPTNWVYEQGLVRNDEAQWYQPANVTCREGLLVIEARRERVANPDHDPKGTTWKTRRVASEYTSGSIKTKGLHSWRYGRFEMRGRIDVRPGLWPAFWTVGAVGRPWPSGGELDIMEYFKGVLLANAAWGSATPFKAIWDDSRTPLTEIAKPGTVEAWASEFHVWRMDWDEAWIRFYVDDRLLNEVDLSTTVNQSADGVNPFHEPHLIILNLAVGGTSGGDPSKTEFPARFEVDWVRVYQRPDHRASQPGAWPK